MSSCYYIYHMFNEEKLNEKLNIYYEALAQEDSLSVKEKTKLYKDINREINKLNNLANNYKE